MIQLILKRIVESIIVLFCVTTITFVLIKQAPGGPFDTDKAVDPDVMKQLLAYYHLDDPLPVQYYNYLKNIITEGDFGPSFVYSNRTVTDLIFEGLPETFELAILSIFYALLIGVVAGVIAALKKNTTIDYAAMSLAMIGICVPTFLMGPILQYVFSIKLGWLPVSGWGVLPGDKIMPSLTLGAVFAAYVARLGRGGMLEILSQDFIRTARAKGVSEAMVIIRHAMRGGMIPVVSFLGPAIAGLLGGSFVVETIFSIPGMGRFYVQAAVNRDYCMILGTTILLSTFILMFNLVSDILTIIMNPKLRSDLSK